MDLHTSRTLCSMKSFTMFILVLKGKLNTKREVNRSFMYECRCVCHGFYYDLEDAREREIATELAVLRNPISADLDAPHGPEDESVMKD
jgi:hypothetical protein